MPLVPLAPRSRPRPGAIALLALAGLLLGVLLWARGTPCFLGWEVARDHSRCLGRTQVRARLWTNEPGEVREWLESRGTPVQPLPARAGDLVLLGVRYCALADRIAGHVYYGGPHSYVSVFVLAGPARVRDGWRGRCGGLSVRLLHSAGRTLAVVGGSPADVDALADVLVSTLA